MIPEQNLFLHDMTSKDSVRKVCEICTVYNTQFCQALVQNHGLDRIEINSSRSSLKHQMGRYKFKFNHNSKKEKFNIQLLR